MSNYTVGGRQKTMELSTNIKCLGFVFLQFAYKHIASESLVVKIIDEIISVFFPFSDFAP